MKSSHNIFRFIALLAFVLLAAGCASNNHMLNRENAAIGAGFKIIKPNKPAQEAVLQKLPADKITRIHHDGKIYYVLPDPAHDRLYVGGPKQYQAYLQFRRDQQMNAESYQPPVDIVEVVGENAVDWGAWDGWGSPETLDGMIEPGWY